MLNPNILQMVSQLKQNPVSFLAKMGVNIPPNMGNDPNAITQYLMNSGKISQEQYNQAVKMAQSFKR